MSKIIFILLAIIALQACTINIPTKSAACNTPCCLPVITAPTKEPCDTKKCDNTKSATHWDPNYSQKHGTWDYPNQRCRSYKTNLGING